MKKIIMIVSMLLSFGSVHAAEDQFVSTLLDHVMTVTQFKDGATSLALVDSVVQIGSVKGRSILDLQGGFNTNTKPEPGESDGASLIAGAYFKVSSLLGTKIHFPEHWKFLQSIEHGVAYFYDFRDKKDFVSYQVGLAFSLNPKQ